MSSDQVIVISSPFSLRAVVMTSVVILLQVVLLEVLNDGWHTDIDPGRMGHDVQIAKSQIGEQTNSHQDWLVVHKYYVF
jgi:hypothetical protein